MRKHEVIQKYLEVRVVWRERAGQAGFCGMCRSPCLTGWWWVWCAGTVPGELSGFTFLQDPGFPFTATHLFFSQLWGVATALGARRVLGFHWPFTGKFCFMSQKGFGSQCLLRARQGEASSVVRRRPSECSFLAWVAIPATSLCPLGDPEDSGLLSPGVARAGLCPPPGTAAP